MTEKVNSGMKRFIINLKSFSLVELIIVIAIVAILSFTGFLTLQKWIGESRDSKRLGDISTLKNSLEINYVDSSTPEKYPFPDPNNDDSKVTVGELNGTNLTYKGTVGSGVAKDIGVLNKVPKDPSGKRYEYGVTYDQEEYQIGAILENGKRISYKLFDVGFAGERVAEVDGNYDTMIFYKSGDKSYISNIPSLIYDGCKFKDGNINLGSGGVIFMRNGGKNLPYQLDKKVSCRMMETPGEVLSKMHGFQETESMKVEGVNISYINNENDLSQKFTGNTLKSFGGDIEMITQEVNESGVMETDSYSDGKPELSNFNSMKVMISTGVKSNIKKVTNIQGGREINVGGEGNPRYRICEDALCDSVIKNWIADADTIYDGNYVQLKMDSADSMDVTYTGTLNIGNINREWGITTINADGDYDNDGISNSQDNCISEKNPNQTDADNDGIGDICDNTFNSDDGGDVNGDFALSQNSWSADLTPYTVAKPSREFYCYDGNCPNPQTTNRASSNLADSYNFVESQVSTLFMYRDADTGKTTLGMIHDKPNDGSGGNVDFSFSGNGWDDGQIVVSDDTTYHGAGGEFTKSGGGSWNWSSCCTDGGMIEIPDSSCITIDPSFNSGIDKWIIKTPNGTQEIPSMSDPVEICSQ